MLRDPVKRSTSAFLFRGHNPNWDRFNVREEFPNYPTKQPKYTFTDYLGFNEYRNIMTRMFALDSFPYRNLTITYVEFSNAIKRLEKYVKAFSQPVPEMTCNRASLNHISVFYRFKVIGIQEAFDSSAKLLLYTFNVSMDESAWKENYDSKRMPLKSSIARSPRKYKKLQPQTDGIAAANEFDVKLYQWAVGRFCKQLCESNLWQEDGEQLCLKWNHTCSSLSLRPIAPDIKAEIAVEKSVFVEGDHASDDDDIL